MDRFIHLRNFTDKTMAPLNEEIVVSTENNAQDVPQGKPALLTVPSLVEISKCSEDTGESDLPDGLETNIGVFFNFFSCQPVPLVLSASVETTDSNENTEEREQPDGLEAMGHLVVESTLNLFSRHPAFSRGVCSECNERVTMAQTSIQLDDGTYMHKDCVEEALEQLETAVKGVYYYKKKYQKEKQKVQEKEAAEEAKQKDWEAIFNSKKEQQEQKAQEEAREQVVSKAKEEAAAAAAAAHRAEIRKEVEEEFARKAAEQKAAEEATAKQALKGKSLKYKTRKLGKAIISKGAAAVTSGKLAGKVATKSHKLMEKAAVKGHKLVEQFERWIPQRTAAPEKTMLAPSIVKCNSW